ncbi:hypothetical protein HZA33_05035 [Candidatus Pacearchaeota archaeon]|nr:hypothetical protein [Candidatus Pacearchaeota archaeon]
MILDVIPEGVKKFSKQPVILLPYIFRIVATVLIVTPIILYSYLFLANIGFTPDQNMTISQALEQDPQLAYQILAIFSSPAFIILSLLTIIALMFALSYFSSAALAMAVDISKGKKVKFADIKKYGIKFWLRYLAVFLLIFLVFLPIVAIAILLFALLEVQLFTSIILAILAIAAFFFLILFVLAPSMLVLYDVGAKQAIKKSFTFTKKNYWSFLALLLIMLVIIAAISYIPFIGDIVNVFIIPPIQAIIFIIFLLKKSGKEQKEEKEVKKSKK